MGVDFADVDRDGNVDFFVVDMLSRDHQRRKMQMGAMKPTPVAIGLIENRPQVMRNTFFHSRGDGTFAEMAYFAGLHASEWSWQPVFLDVDLDGFEDVLVTSGHARDVQDADKGNEIKKLQSEGKLIEAAEVKSYDLLAKGDVHTAELLAMSKLRPRLNTAVVAFRNNGDLTFDEQDWGTGQLGVHHGIATGDFDGDGDLDFVVNNLGSHASLYRNDAAAPRVAVRLRGARGNAQGIGAHVVLRGGAVPMQDQEMISGGRYLSGSAAQLCFAAGKAKDGMTLEVTWRSGKISVVTDIKANSLVIVDEANAVPVEKKSPKVKPPLFTDTSALLGHIHHEAPFDDFIRQLLLPNRLSQLGPGISWGDLNGDGHDDILIGSGKDAATAVYLADGKGKFAPFAHPLLSQATPRDQTSILTFGPKADETSVLVGLSNFEDGKVEGTAVIGDGELDLFVGGRSVPGKYPAPATSGLFLRKAGKFVADETNGALSKDLGLVSGAVFSDLNGDGAPDLVFAIEWGPVAVFLNDGRGGFTNATEKLGLARELGWWNSVTTGDFDGDGQMDIVVGNWGRNSKYEHHYNDKHPLLVYWCEFGGGGITQVVESHFDHAMHKLVPERGLSCSSPMPFIKKIAPTYQRFGGFGLADLYGEKLAAAPSLKASTLESKVFLNRGDRFEARALPVEAPLTPVLGINVADFDGDGAEDLFLGQNFFAAQIETPRIDAGRGLILRRHGKGNFSPMTGLESGINIPGDARGSAVADYNGDGRPDLAVGQNAASTKLFRNTGAKPGLRVRLNGRAGNATALGAQIRIVAGEKRGPARELHGGSGYWSQDSAVAVLPVPESGAKLWTRWPGGTETVTDIRAGALQVIAAAPGEPAGRK